MRTGTVWDEKGKPIEMHNGNMTIYLCDHNSNKPDTPLFKARLLAAWERNEILTINGLGYVITVSSCVWPRCRHLSADDKACLYDTGKNWGFHVEDTSKWACSGRYHTESRRPTGIKAANIL